MFWGYIICYVLGAIPSGLLLSKFFNFNDLRKEGSGNIGASNAFRTGGVKLGFFTFIFDVAKGVIAYLLFQNEMDPTIGFLFVVLGNIFSIFLKFDGGKGVAAFCGWHLAACFPLGFANILVWFMITLLFEVPFYSSLIVLFFSLFFYMSFWKFCTILMILYAHRKNFQAFFKSQEKGITEINE